MDKKPISIDGIPIPSSANRPKALSNTCNAPNIPYAYRSPLHHLTPSTPSSTAHYPIPPTRHFLPHLLRLKIQILLPSQLPIHPLLILLIRLNLLPFLLGHILRPITRIIRRRLDRDPPISRRRCNRRSRIGRGHRYWRWRRGGGGESL